jgi:hypothetical protein
MVPTHLMLMQYWFIWQCVLQHKSTLHLHTHPDYALQPTAPGIAQHWDLGEGIPPDPRVLIALRWADSSRDLCACPQPVFRDLSVQILVQGREPNCSRAQVSLISFRLVNYLVSKI